MWWGQSESKRSCEEGAWRGGAASQEGLGGCRDELWGHQQEGLPESQSQSNTDRFQPLYVSRTEQGQQRSQRLA